MPSLFLGTGTDYRGVEHLHEVADWCEACAAVTVHQSFDTTEVRRFLMIPVRRLRRLRVLRACVGCGHHEIIAWDDWAEGRAGLQPTVREAVRPGAAPEGLDLALRACVLFEHPEGIGRLEAAVRRDHADDAALWAKVGGAWLRVGRPEAATGALQAALALAPSPTLRFTLALAQSLGPRPEEAEATLAGMLAAGDGGVGLLAAEAAEALRAAGRPREALDLLERLAGRDPTVARDRRLIRLRRRLERGSGGPSASKLPGVRWAVPWRSWRPAWWQLAAFWVVVVMPVYLYWPRLPEVFLVNGLEVPYEVMVGDEAVLLPPLSSRRIRPGAGDHRLVAQGLPPGEAEVDLTLSRTWGFDPKPDVVVVNPDRTAVLLQQSVVYDLRPGARPVAAPGPRLHAAQVVYRFPDLDHPFEAPPETMQAPTGQTQAKREQLTVLALPWDESLPLLAAWLPEDRLAEVVRARARMAAGPDPRQTSR